MHARPIAMFASCMDASGLFFSRCGKRICTVFIRVYKEECAFSFASPLAPSGLFLNLTTWQVGRLSCPLIRVLAHFPFGALLLVDWQPGVVPSVMGRWHVHRLLLKRAGDYTLVPVLRQGYSEQFLELDRERTGNVLYLWEKWHKVQHERLHAATINRDVLGRHPGLLLSVASKRQSGADIHHCAQCSLPLLGEICS